MRAFGIAAVCLALAWPAGAVTLYGLREYVVDANLGNTVLHAVDTEGGGARVIGDLNGHPFDPFFGLGLASDRRGLVGMVSDADGEVSLMRIDAHTGVGTAMTEVTGIYGDYLGGLAFHSGRFWTLERGNQLVRINPRNGRAVAKAVISDLIVNDLTFARGKLYGTSGFGIYRINRKTGATRQVAESNFWSLSGLAYDRGVFFSVSTDGTLVRLEGGSSRGIAAAIAGTSLTKLRGEAALMAEARAPAPVPLPAAGGLLLLGAAALALAARGRMGGRPPRPAPGGCVRRRPATGVQD